jgi:hypothetical protein
MAHGIEGFEKLVFSQKVKKFPALYETDYYTRLKDF